MAISEFAEKVLLFAILVLGIPCSITLIILGNASTNNNRSLDNEGIITDAKITNIRVDAGEEVGYDIQYHFRAGSDGIWYSYSDETGRTNLWYAPTEEEWETAKRTNQIKITYLPEDPWINHPLGENGIGDAYGLQVLGILVGVLWIWLFINKVKNRGENRHTASTEMEFPYQDSLDDQEAAEWLEALNSPPIKQEPSNKWFELLAERNTYQAVYDYGGSKLLATLVFCELFVAICITIQNQTKEGQPQFVYKMREGVDVSFFNPIEKVVAGAMYEFRSLAEIIAKASNRLDHLKVDLKGETSTLSVDLSPEDIRSRASQYQKIITAALETSPAYMGGCS